MGKVDATRYVYAIPGAGGEGETLLTDFQISWLCFWLVKKLTGCITANIPILIIPFLSLASL